MARPTRSVRRTVAATKSVTPSAGIWKFPLTKMNFIIFAGALGVIVVAYLLMLTGIAGSPEEHEATWNNTLAVDIAPTLLVIAYCGLIPFALLYRDKQQEEYAPAAPDQQEEAAQ